MVCWAVAVVGIVLVAVSAAGGPLLRTVCTDLVELGSGVLVAVGIRWNLADVDRSVRRTFWLFVPWLIGIGLGDLLWNVLDLAGSAPSLDIAIAGPVYLCSYLFVGWALVRIVRTRAGRHSKDILIDGVIFATAALVVIWVLLVPGADASGQGWFETAVLGAYPLMDVLLVAGLSWLVLSPGRRPLSMLLLGGHLLATLAADVVWMAVNRYAPDADPNLVNLVWPLSNVLLALAVLHPSVREVAVAREGSEGSEVPIVRLGLIGTALFVPEVVMVLAGSRPLSDTIVLLVSAALLVSLVLWRVAALLADKERARAELRKMYVALERSQERLNHQATHDPLTGLINRAELMRTMTHLLRNRPPTASAAVLFVDLDSFKEVNDAEGHAVGDALLIVLAARLQGAVRPGDIVARFGGDEFVVVLPRATEDEAIVVAERIIERCSQPVVAHEVRTRVGASVGITVLDGSADADSVLRSADAAMYEAKRSGRSRYALRRLAA